MAKRNTSLDYLRVLACLGVIMFHTAGGVEYHNMVEHGTLHWAICVFFVSLSSWCVPVFAMLTGYFMLNPLKKINIKKIYSKYILHILIVLVVWSVFYAITTHSFFYPFGPQGLAFWYLGMCIGLYSAIPILRHVAKDATITKYFCWTWFGYKAYFFCGYFVTLPFEVTDLMFVDYVGYCLWAYYLSMVSLEKKSEILLYIVGGICLFINFIGRINGLTWGGYCSVPTIIMSISLFYFFSHHNIRISGTIDKLVQSCSLCTLGIFLLHVWILIQVHTRIFRFVPDAVLTCIITVVIVFGIGYIITFLLKKIPFVGKWIV